MNLKIWGLFLLRVVFGAIFVAHGWAKISGIEGTIGFFSSLGLPAFMAYVVAWVEFLGGIAVILGVFTLIAAYLLAITMVVAIFLVKIRAGFLGGYELDLILLVSALVVAWSDIGPYSVSSLVSRRKAGNDLTV